LTDRSTPDDADMSGRSTVIRTVSVEKMEWLLVEAARQWLELNPVEATVDDGWCPGPGVGHPFLLAAERAIGEAELGHSGDWGRRHEQLSQARTDPPPPKLFTFVDLPSREWGVYRIYSRDDTLVYVGMTGQPRKRLRSHMRRFGDRFATYTWTPAASAAHAASLESSAIRSESPTDNIAGTGR
jgi:predicted GIY-YIG superfamily endonuclease